MSRRRAINPRTALYSFLSPARRFSTSPRRCGTLTDRPPTHTTVLLQSPSQEYLEKEEMDVQILSEDEAKLQLTDRAAERLRQISGRERNPDAALRVAVESGGCHGYQYKLQFANQRAPDDYTFSHPSIKPSNVLVDAVSLTLLNGSTIDYATELIGSSFRVLNNPRSQGSGCGCGVSWELKV
ncbi:hypothetical protein FISHEDRAFT_32188 [Fistulina hepatica ATCC 64428]|uniref:Core domain-containing protein n=1 Tax=Fistulina hepatica ATCC 64428 TaxID=1128425 RepID=A0A0D7AT59_9AGAR|nr:hypothetical protein FISHEDRAFT_32188 [Fistulina hepatica ATCC 64428]